MITMSLKLRSTLIGIAAGGLALALPAQSVGAVEPAGQHGSTHLASRASQPLDLRVAQDGAGLSVSWSVPNGDTPLGYEVSHSPDGTTWTDATGVERLTTRISGLAMDASHWVRVRAMYSGGRSSDWVRSGPVDVLSGTTPGRVQGLQVAINEEGYLEGWWDAPASIGGAPVDHYLVEWFKPSGRFTRAATTTSTTSRFFGTFYDLPYARLQVTAVNSFGSGIPVISTVRIGPVSGPIAPAELTAVPWPGGARLTWNPPTNDGGSEIKRYDIRWMASVGMGLAGIEESMGTDTSFVLTGLEPGRAHEISIRSVTAAGTSSFSQPVTVTPLSLGPSEPVGVTVTPTKGGATVSWSPPLHTGGEEIRDYIVWWQSTTDPTDEHIDFTSGSVTQWDLTGLTSGETYNVSVTARAGFASGMPSPLVTVMPEPTEIFGVTLARVGTGSFLGSRVAVSWSGPTLRAGERYSVALSTDGAPFVHAKLVSSTSTSLFLAGTASRVTVRVCTVNASAPLTCLGLASDSAELILKEPVSAPEQVSLERASGLSNLVRVSWQAPQSGPALAYIVSTAVDGNSFDVGKRVVGRSTHVNVPKGAMILETRVCVAARYPSVECAGPWSDPVALSLAGNPG